MDGSVMMVYFQHPTIPEAATQKPHKEQQQEHRVAHDGNVVHVGMQCMHGHAGPVWQVCQDASV